ncbi:hypothetical protein [Mycobacterium sp. OTB74]|jgi:hypothetical protein|uniref:hypothetical protein n=1 Tax=Mycobacterium sp. OTB74 TaxID=1853452 RepID=UPI0024764803|nr:hypothetical protein [Mycobacterium sp. OTB74]MDH6244851.1 hypothetical protein [Mycobacterium sp. OTB74]
MEGWFRSPPLARVAVIIMAWFGYGFLVLRMLGPQSADRIGLWVGAACVVGAGVTVGLDHRLHRKFGSVEQLRAYRRALRTGDFPEGADPGVWLRRLAGSQAWCAFAWLLVGPYVLFGLMAGMYWQSEYRWAPTAAFGIFAVWGFGFVALRGSRVKRLTAAIRNRRSALRAVDGTAPDRQSARREEMFAQSLAQRLGVGALTWIIIASLMLLVADLDSLFYGGPSIIGLRWAVGCAALLGMAWMILSDERDLRRNFDSYDQYAEYNSTLRTGSLPAAVVPDTWKARLHTSRRENLFRLVWAGYLVAVGAAALIARQSPYHWVIASLYELVAIWLLINWWVMRERLAMLTGAVERHVVRQTWG